MINKLVYICPLQNTKQAMDKSNKKINKYNEDILNVLIDRYGYSIDYIRKSLRGDRTGIVPDKLIAEYNKLDAASKKAIENKANKL